MYKAPRSAWKASCYLSFLALLPLSVFGQSQLRRPLTRHVRQVTRNGEARYVQHLSSDQMMQLDLVLPLNNEAGLDAFLQALYDPASPAYRQYLSAEQFTAQFGPTQEQYDAVINFANENGLTVVGGTREGMDVQVKGPVSAVENAFHITMSVYQHPSENHTFYAPDNEPTTTLPFQLWHISGLDNYSIPRPNLVKRSDYAQANGLNEADIVTHATTGSGPSGSFLGSDMRAAYYGTGTLDGTGQNLGLLEFQGTNLADVNTYYKNVGQTNNVPITLYSVDGTSTACTYSRHNACDDTEPTIDITQAAGMAPRLASLVVYVGSTDTAILSAMTTHSPLPTTIGCSWGWSPADPSTLDTYFKRMAAQGQTFFTASGDNSTWTTKNYEWPADDPYVVTVGGTDLVTTGAVSASNNGAWQSETAWVDSGGGYSTDSIAIPSWQLISGVINSSNKGSTTLRNGPDVAANANFSFYVCADQTTCTANGYGGTSFAAPMWAGYLALVNQQAGSAGPVGFINPAIYQQNAGSASTYAANFHDIKSGTSGSYSAVAGYDLVTGWGSPNSGLIGALTNPTFYISANPGALSVAAGGTVSVTITATGSFKSSISLTASAPTGITASVSSTPIAAGGSASLSVVVGSTVTPGTYAVAVTGTSGANTQSAVISVTVTAQNAFTVSVSPNSASVSRGQSTSATVKVQGTSGSGPTISLSASGQPSGVTVSFSPLTGSGNSTMRVSVSRNAATGTYPITITAKSGSTSQTATYTLQVSH